MPVTGQPSLRLVEIGGGGIESVLVRNSPWTEYMDSKDVQAIEKMMETIEAEARKLSRGPLSYKRLKAMGHPYGMGRRRGLGRLTRVAGVSNLSVVNLHSGGFLRSWGSRVEWRKSGVRMVLFNTHFAAAWLALGTRNKMKAHGPFTAAIVRHLAALNRLWAAASRRAYERAKLEAELV